MTDALPNSPTQVAQQAADFQWGEGKAQAGIGLALSGGGFRAMLFHAGVLARMNELGLLAKAKRIASVSGGSIISGYLAIKWAELSKSVANDTFANFKSILVEPILAFIQAEDRCDRCRDRTVALGGFRLGAGSEKLR